MAELDSRPCTLVTEGVVGTLYLPKVDNPFPAAVLIGGSEGVEPQMSAEALARQGFAALSIAYFKRPGLPPALREIPLEYFERALIALRRALEPRRGPLVVIGASRGSEAALLAGVHFPDMVSAVVAIDPGNVVLCSWPPGGPAWTFRGKALPYVTRFGPSAADPAAEIEVERIRGPILLLSAGSDSYWPSTLMAKAIVSRLNTKGHRYPDEHLDFPLSGHGLGRAGSKVSLEPGQRPPSRDDAAFQDQRAALVKVREFFLRLG